MVKRQTELEVFKQAFDAAMEIFEQAKKFPKSKTYSLQEQYDSILAMLVAMARNSEKWIFKK